MALRDSSKPLANSLHAEALNTILILVEALCGVNNQ